MSVGSATHKDHSEVLQGATVDHEVEGDVEMVEGYGELTVDQVASRIVAQVMERVTLRGEDLRGAEEGESGGKVSVGT